MYLKKIAGKRLTTIALAMTLIFASTGVLLANQTPSEVLEGEKITGTFVEGPHIFFKKDKVLIKQVAFASGKTKLIEKAYNSKSDIPELTCSVQDKKNTTFPVTLHSNYKVPPTTYRQPEKLFAISDIEGNFGAFTKTLIGNQIIDKNFNWIYGDGHLVLVGDFFDRGFNVTPVLWLIYKLEMEAEEAGGMVHFIIGNHEEMNMRGDVRYVKEKYIKAAKVMNCSYDNLYSEETELGRWLRSKNIIEKIGNTIFVHGGLSPEMANMRIRLEGMNSYARKYFGHEKWRLEQRGGGASAVFSKVGPMWYRGYFREHLSQNEIDDVLHLYNAEHVVVGHTIVPRVSSLFEGKVIAIDVKHDIAVAEGFANSIVFENGTIWATNVNGKRNTIEAFLTEEIVVKIFNDLKVGRTEEVREFVKYGTRLNKHYFSKRVTLLHEAIRHNKPGIAKLLIDAGADLELASENMTPLMFAIEQNNWHLVDVLLRNGADINTINQQGKSALFYCAKHGTPKAMKLLLDRGANINQMDKKGRKAINYAMECKNNEVVEFLKKYKD